MCEYEIDVRRVPKPHEAVSQLVGDHQTVCPFVAGQQTPATALVTSFGESCRLNGGPDLKVVKRTLLAFPQFMKEIQGCDPLLSTTPTPPETSRSAGPVFVVTANETSDRSSLQHFSELDDALKRGGLPVDYAVEWGVNGTHYFCFEMKLGDDVDPLSFLAAKSPWLARNGEERRSNAPNCGKAAHQLGVEAPTRAPASPATVIAPYTLSIRRSTGSPEYQNYRSAVLNAFRGAGAAVTPETADPREHSLLADRDTYVKFNLGIPDLPRTVVVVAFNQLGFHVTTTDLSPAFCAGVFATLLNTNSFVADVDGQAPDIAPEGIRGDPPPRVLFRSLTWARDAQDLCRAMRPGFDRWRSAAADPSEHQ